MCYGGRILEWLPFPPQGDSNPGIKFTSLAPYCQAGFFTTETLGRPKYEIHILFSQLFISEEKAFTFLAVIGPLI